ncbi:MAG TPA: Omp28-related outer membrane protein [Bacteroidia bacterium]|nr:Omp28-related outer membrane protein [Bacteroidia bacterium]HNT79473.1 Omp28-related outer membrane protein [Bacteroidia bacterium]
MKRLLLVLPALALLFTACKKDESNQPVSRISNSPIVAAVPTSFTQKVLLENFTGTSYNKSPMNDFEISTLQSSLGNRLIPVSIHTGDAMATTQSNEIFNRINNGSLPNIPSAMINRRKSNNSIFYLNQDWNAMISLALNNNSTTCGLAISSSYNGNIIEVVVSTGFANVPNTNYNVTVYLTEDEVSSPDQSYAQANIYNSVGGNPFFNMGNPIASYEHNHTLRFVASQSGGDAIDMQNVMIKQEDTKTYIIDLPNNFNPAKMNVVAFIHSPGLTSNGLVLNAQTAKLGSIQNYD